MTLLDSTFINVPVAILTAWTTTSQPVAAGSLIIENLSLNNVPVVIRSTGGTAVLAGSPASQTITAWGQGHQYTPNGPTRFQGRLTSNAAPSVLLGGSSSNNNPTRYYARSKPQYEDLRAGDFLSARSAGARGDGTTDDTAALQAALDAAAAANKVLWLDFGLYRLTSTLTVPPGSRIVGESYPVLLSSGRFFADQRDPQPVLRVGAVSGQAGYVELSDFVVGTQGAQGGAVLIQWNLDSTGGGRPSGMWDVHTRIGGFAGSQLQATQCLKQPGNSNVNPQCIGAYMSMHVTKGAANLYMENTWIWTADHDLDDGANTQITVFAGRGLCKSGRVGTVWEVCVRVVALTGLQISSRQRAPSGWWQRRLSTTRSTSISSRARRTSSRRSYRLRRRRWPYFLLFPPPLFLPLADPLAPPDTSSIGTTSPAQRP